MSEVKIIDKDELKAWIDNKRKFNLIDVLPADYYEAKHLPSAKNACIYDMTFLDQIESIISDQDKPIVVYSASVTCKASTVAAERLAEAGCTTVFQYKGGVKEWGEAEFGFAGNDPSKWADGPSLNSISAAFNVDSENSRIQWTGRNVNGSHTGMLTISNGQILIDDGKIKSGMFSVDMNSMTCRDLVDETYNKLLIDHLKSDDFFSVTNFPEVTFDLTSVDPIADSVPGSPNYTLLGNLKIKGNSNNIDFPGIITLKAVEGPLILQAYFDFDRTRWDVLYGSGKYFEKLGMHLVYDSIGIQLMVVANNNTV